MFRVRVPDSEIKKKLDRFDDTVDSDTLNETEFLLTLDLLESKKYLWIRKLLDEATIDRSKSDIFISLRSNFDTGIIDLPDWVRGLICLLDIKVVLSYTII
jgi:cell wall assembly regulator SMI1